MDDIANVLSVLAICVSLVSLLVALYLNREQQSTQAFISYTEKHDKITNEISELWGKRGNLDIKDLMGQEKDNVITQLLPYFHLCSQQFHLYTHGLIKTALWEIWEPAIENNLCAILFKSAWNESKAKKEFEHYEDYRDFVNELVEKGPGKRVADSYMRITRPFSGRSR